MYIDVGHNKPVKQTTRGFEINLIPMPRRSYWHPLVRILMSMRWVKLREKPGERLVTSLD